jgi:multiple sugar transport system substrate-binding protein
MLYAYDLDLIAQAGVKEENYNAAAWARTDIGDEHYGIPLDVHSYVTYYNKDLFDQYDLNSYVEDGYLTFDEVKELGDKAKAAGFTGYVTDLGWMRAQLLCYYGQLDHNLTLSADGINPCINNDNMRKVFETMKDLWEGGYTSVKNTDYSSEFYSGNMLVWSEGIWMKAAAVDAGINFGMLPAICYTPEDCMSWTSSHNFVQFADENRTEEEDLAVAKFINFMGENSLTWALTPASAPLTCPSTTSRNSPIIRRPSWRIRTAPTSWPSTSICTGDCSTPRSPALAGTSWTAPSALMTPWPRLIRKSLTRSPHSNQ